MSIPKLNYSTPLLETSFVFAHNAATGYMTTPPISDIGQYLTKAFAKNQEGSFYDQLNDGAKALDLRVQYSEEKGLQFKHGKVVVEEIEWSDGINDIIRFHEENEDEPVILVYSHLRGEGALEAIQESFTSFNISMVECADLVGVTIGEALELAGSSLFALNDCAKSNWFEGELVYCYSPDYEPCTDADWTVAPFTDLQDYVRMNMENSGEDNFSMNIVQGSWQGELSSYQESIFAGSNLLQDNSMSAINGFLLKLVEDDSFSSLPINLLSIDNVLEGGKELERALRIRCCAENTVSPTISPPTISPTSSPSAEAADLLSSSAPNHLLGGPRRILMWTLTLLTLFKYSSSL